jgi:hypothetical protein
MAKRPSLFQTKATVAEDAEPQPPPTQPVNESGREEAASRRSASRAGKRVLSVYLDPLAWKQMRQLALDTDRTTQALGEEAINLLFAKHGLNRSA